ncbi:HEAT repeat-containing protein 2, partial [Perkinsus olseni]
QDLLLLLGDAIEVHAGRSITTDVLSTALDVIQAALAISSDTITIVPRVLKAMLHLKEGLSDALVTRLFGLLLQCVASTSESAEVGECIALLAAREGTSPAAVYDMYFDVQLSGILAESLDDNWSDSDPSRKMLHELLRRTSTMSLARCFNDGLGGQLIEMLCFQSDPDRCTPSCRVDVIESVYDVARRASEEGGGPLLEALKKSSQTPSDTEPHHLTIGCVSTTIDLPRASPPAVSLVTGVLLSNLIWRPGQANTRIRKASLLALHTILPAIEPNWMRSILDELIPLLKSSLDDAFTPDNRHLATTVIIDIFGKMADDQQLDEFDAEVLRECYPDLLKRLDDSVDEIRILACRALEVLMEVLSSRPGTMKALSNSVFG